MQEEWSAMILTGGQSSRFGSDKSRAILGGQSLLSHLLSDLADIAEIVIVGPSFEDPLRSLRFVQEEPLGGGPVAAVSAGLQQIHSEFVALIATDMPFAGEVIRKLAKTLSVTKDGVLPRDSEGIPQALCAIYRTTSLKNALAKLGNPVGRSMRSLVSLLELEEVELSPSLESSLIDIDTPEELEKASRTRKVATMDKWIEEVKKELGITINFDIDSILDTARDAAHTIERKAAPVTTFLLGYAVAAGADVEEAVKKITELAKNWPVKS